MSDDRDDKLVGEHYGRGALAAKILEALRAAGKDPDDLTTEDLAPVDQFHIRGREATLDLALLAGITPRMRVLDVGGGLGGPALHEIMAGQASPIHLPVPWARDPSTSHLQTPETIRSLIAITGFNESVWVDETASALGWIQRRLSATASEGPPPLGLHLLLGPAFGQMLHNQALNLSENRISVVQAAFKRP